jgi:hypothetical protein
MATAAINPTGLSNAMATTNWGSVSKGGPVMGSPYPTGGPGNFGFGNSTNPNPPGTGPSAPVQFPGTTGTGVGAQTGGSTGFGSGMPFNSGQNTDPQGLQSKLSDIFGSGLGNFISQFLTSGGGYNSAITQQDINAQIQNMQHNIQTGYGNLQNELGAQGVSPLSSVNALESSNYQAQATAEENQLVAQDYYNMWNQSMANEVSILGGVLGPAHQHQGNAGDWANQFAAVGGVFSGAGYQSSSGSGFTL